MWTGRWHTWCVHGEGEGEGIHPISPLWPLISTPERPAAAPPRLHVSCVQVERAFAKVEVSKIQMELDAYKEPWVLGWVYGLGSTCWVVTTVI